MAKDLYIDEGDDGNLWVCSGEWGTTIAVCREVNGQWFAAEDDSFLYEVGPFKTLDDLLDQIERRRLFAPWGSPGV
jgi:hypothetical protein